MAYSTMHLTEVSLAFDRTNVAGDDAVSRGKVEQNATHPSLNRYVTWMVLGLPALAKDPKRTSNLERYVVLIVDNSYVHRDIL